MKLEELAAMHSGNERLQRVAAIHIRARDALARAARELDELGEPRQAHGTASWSRGFEKTGLDHLDAIVQRNRPLDLDAPPGTNEYRGGNCGRHGENIPHVRRLGNGGDRYQCVDCVRTAQNAAEQSVQSAP